jgi:hypothetical protein
MHGRRVMQLDKFYSLDLSAVFGWEDARGRYVRSIYRVLYTIRTTKVESIFRKVLPPSNVLQESKNEIEEHIQNNINVVQ